MSFDGIGAIISYMWEYSSDYESTWTNLSNAVKDIDFQTIQDSGFSLAVGSTLFRRKAVATYNGSTYETAYSNNVNILIQSNDQNEIKFQNYSDKATLETLDLATLKVILDDPNLTDFTFKNSYLNGYSSLTHIDISNDGNMSSITFDSDFKVPSSLVKFACTFIQTTINLNNAINSTKPNLSLNSAL